MIAEGKPRGDQASAQPSQATVAPARPIRFVNNPGQPPSKRRRITAACLTCRKRKTRCAGERPVCSTCSENGHTCLGYGDDTEKERDGGGRGKLKPRASAGQPSTATPVTATARISEDGARHQPSPHQYRWQSTPRLSNASPQEAVRTPSSAGNVNEGAAVLSPMRPPLSPGRDRSSVSSSRCNDRLPNNPTTPATLTAENLPDANDVRRTAGHRVPFFRYFGPTAIVPGYKQMVVSVRDRKRSANGGSQPGTSPLSTQPGVALGSSVAAESDVMLEDPPIYDPSDANPVHPFILTLCKTFFTHVGCNYPFLKEAKFMRLVRDKQVEQILVDAVCAIAARFSSAHLLTGGNDKVPRTERGVVYAQRAKATTVDTFPCPSVGAVQALLLMAYEGFGANQDSALWMYLGLAIRMAIDLGLQKRIGIQYQGEKDPWYLRHRSILNEESESPEDRRHEDPSAVTYEEQKEVEQERIDTFWAVFVLDRVISSGTGRPVTFREDDFELSFPEPHVDAKTGWPAPMPIFLEIIHLYGQVLDILNKVRDMKDLTADKWDILSKKEHQLTKAYKGWDTRLHFNVINFRAYLEMGQGTTFILMHFWFHALFITLHQPTLMFPFGNLRDDAQLLPDSRELSMSSAKTICDILSFADLIDSKSFIGNPFTSQPMYIAACAFLTESNAKTSQVTSRETSPPEATSTSRKSQGNPASRAKHSRHSLLASAANQNYQRCYSSLQQLHDYWGGVKYILTALDQKAKGIWDPETYTVEEYESTKIRSPSDSMRKLPTFAAIAEVHASASTPTRERPPPIAWTLAGTADSPNSNLTLMYSNSANPISHTNSNPHTRVRPAGTPPGNMIYDPIRQSQFNDTDHHVVTGYRSPGGNASSGRSGGHIGHPLSQALEFDSEGRGSSAQDMSRNSQGSALYSNSSTQHLPNIGYKMQQQQHHPQNHYSGSFDNGMSTSSGCNLASASVADGPDMVSGLGQGHSYPYYDQDVPCPVAWAGGMMRHSDALTFDSQDIDIQTLGLQQPGLMNGWLEYMPGDFLGMMEQQGDMEQGR